jgi:hypothetical protein
MAKGQPAAPTAPAVAQQPTAPAVATPAVVAPATPTAPAVATPTAPAAPTLLYAGAKVPGHRAGHNAAAWAAIAPLLPATAAALAALPQVKACGGSKANGLLFVGYALRRGWLTTTAPVVAPAAPAASTTPAK